MIFRAARWATYTAVPSRPAGAGWESAAESRGVTRGSAGLTQLCGALTRSPAGTCPALPGRPVRGSTVSGAPGPAPGPALSISSGMSRTNSAGVFARCWTIADPPCRGRSRESSRPRPAANGTGTGGCPVPHPGSAAAFPGCIASRCCVLGLGDRTPLSPRACVLASRAIRSRSTDATSGAAH